MREVIGGIDGNRTGRKGNGGGRSGEPRPPGCAIAIRDRELSDTGDRSDSVRSSTTTFSAVIPSAVPALIKALKDKEAEVRSASAAALGAVGPEAKAAVSALVEALKDAESEVRVSAVEAIGGIGPVVVGPPEKVADALEDWVDKTGVDGFNLALAVTPETFEDIADQLVPELQRRGRYKTDYAPGTLREKLFGEAARLPQRHPAAALRWDKRANDAE